MDLEVRNGRFEIAWRERQMFDGRIAPDGTFSATSGSLPGQAEKHMTILPNLQGQVGSGALVADYGTRWCRYRLEATQLEASARPSQRADSIRPHQ